MKNGVKNSRNWKKIMLPIILGIIGVIVLITIFEMQNDAETTEITPQIVDYSHDFSGFTAYSYSVDKVTGCVYIVYKSKYLSGKSYSGMTPMMNPDGTVVTAEQLGLEY